MNGSKIKYIFTAFLIVVLAAALLIVSLSQGTKPAMREVDPKDWHSGGYVEFEYFNEDTLSQRSITLLLRTDKDFATVNRTLPLKITTITPDSIQFEEEWTLDVVSADITGSTKNFQEIAQLYRGGAILSKKGLYLFRIAPDRSGTEGVWAVGIDIE